MCESATVLVHASVPTSSLSLRRDGEDTPAVDPCGSVTSLTRRQRPSSPIGFAPAAPALPSHQKCSPSTVFNRVVQIADASEHSGSRAAAYRVSR